MAGSLYLLPIAFSIFLPATFFVSYFLSALLGHVYPIFPNISETGTNPPESSFFGLMLNISAAMLFLVIYVRHRQIAEYFNIKKFRYLFYKLNLTCSIIGFLSCIGLVLAANFQESNVRIVHDIGLLLCFWCSTFYMVLQVFKTKWMIPDMNSTYLFLFRSTLGILAIIFVILNQTAGVISKKQFEDFEGTVKEGNQTEFKKWDPLKPGWDWHVVASVSEWMMVVLLAVFILTFYKDFARITLYAPEITMTEEPRNQPKTPVPLRSYKNYGFLYQ